MTRLFHSVPGVMLAAAVVSAQAPAGITTTIFNGANLRGWKIERAMTRVADGELRIEESAGWIRTEQAYGDFILRLQVRLASGDSQAAIFVRAYDAPETSKPLPWIGYEIIARDLASEVRIAPRQLDAVPVEFEHKPEPKAVAATDWHTYEIEARGPVLTVKVDGRTEDSLDRLRNPSGYVGLKVRKGKADFRYIDIQTSNVPGAAFGSKVYAPSDPGVVPPVPLQRIEAAYPDDARVRAIEGLARVEGVVAADGTVQNVVVALPLDPQFGADAAAVEAFRQWRFTPGTKDGAYVPVRVQAEFTFKLKPN